MDPVKLPDPQGMISRIKAKLPRNCSVRKSPFCEHIIGMRMQGISYHSISAFLLSQGEQYRIPATTIWRNIEATKLKIELPYAEELKERWGGSIDLSAAVEIANQILVQRGRIDKMVRYEESRREKTPGFYNKSIRAEMETLNNMVRTYQAMMEDPRDAVKKRVEADQALNWGVPEATLEGETAAVLTDMILRDELKIGEPNAVGQNKPN